MAEQRKIIGRWKIPWLAVFIARGMDPRQLENRFDALELQYERQLSSSGTVCKQLAELENKFRILEREFQSQLLSSKIDSEMLRQLHHQIAIFSGRLPAPQCPKCSEPLKAGGIQWIDHVKCFAQGKSKK